MNWIDTKADQLWSNQPVPDQETTYEANRQIERELLDRIADASGDGD